MYTFADEIKDLAGDEKIEAVMIGNFGWSRNDEADDDSESYGFTGEDRKPVPIEKKFVMLTWRQAKLLLNYEYDPGYGAADCHAVLVWTTKHTLFTVEYDGSTWLGKVPRMPTEDAKPQFYGGG